MATYDKDFLLSLYRNMVRIRAFEEHAAECFTKGMLAGNIHLSIGQEAAEAGAVEAAALCLCGIKGGVTELVILRLLLRVGKNLVGFVYFLEFFLCLSIAWVQIRVVLLGSLSKGAFYFGLGSVFIDSQYFVIICLCHCFPNFLHLPLSREFSYFFSLFPRKEPKRIRFGSLLLKT